MKTNFLKIKFLSCSALLFFACACGVEDEKTQDVQPIGSEAHGGGGVRGEFLSLRHTFHGLLEDPQILSIIKKYCEWGEQFRSTAELKEAYLRRVTETPLSLTVVKSIDESKYPLVNDPGTISVNNWWQNQSPQIETGEEEWSASTDLQKFQNTIHEELGAYFRCDSQHEVSSRIVGYMLASSSGLKLENSPVKLELIDPFLENILGPETQINKASSLSFENSKSPEEANEICLDQVKRESENHNRSYYCVFVGTKDNQTLELLPYIGHYQPAVLSQGKIDASIVLNGHSDSLPLMIDHQVDGHLNLLEPMVTIPNSKVEVASPVAGEDSFTNVMVDIALQHNARWSLIDFMGTPLLSPLKGSRFTLSMSEIRQQKSTLTLYNVAETLDGLVEKKSIFSRQVKQIHVYESEENPFLYLMSWYPMNY